MLKLAGEHIWHHGIELTLIVPSHESRARICPCHPVLESQSVNIDARFASRLCHVGIVVIKRPNRRQVRSRCLATVFC